jgi:hypothetical protein
MKKGQEKKRNSKFDRRRDNGDVSLLLFSVMEEKERCGRSCHVEFHSQNIVVREVGKSVWGCLLAYSQISTAHIYC